jgi:hypothetical protein
LVIVLAFVVLLAGVIIAFFTRAISERTESGGNVHEVEADILSRSGLEMVVADLQQEVVTNSATSNVGTEKIYIPTSAADAIPIRSGNPAIQGGVDPIPNLVRRSWSGDANVNPRSRASNLNSETDLSLNKHSVGRARWNSHYLIPRDPALYGGPTKSGIIGTDPIPAFTAPDWVMVTKDGPKVLTAPDQSTIGRYAYAVYDEGGLIDVNAAGYPYHVTGVNSSGDKTYTDGLKSIDVGRKGSIGFADLTQVSLSKGVINDLVGWRSYATTQPKSTFTNYDFDDPATTAPNTATRYLAYLRSNTSGLMTVSSLTKAPVAPAIFSRTDQAFTGRQSLINIRRAVGFGQDALQYLTTFSREIDAPTATPAVTSAVVRQRFPLSRLVWLTYQGPSATRAAGDADMALLTGTYGIELNYLQKGTAAEIQKSFGLLWNATDERWDYVGPTGSALQSSIADIATISGRDPNFFELLQAGTLTGSLGGSMTSTFPVTHQASKMLHVLTIGANLISQSTVDSYPSRIACLVNVSGTFKTMEAVGSERLPYINTMAACAVGSGLSTGGAGWFLIPNIWDPYRNTSAMTALPLRPAVQITMNGSVSFAGEGGGITTPLGTTLTTGSTGMSRALLAGNTSGGRDGLSGGFADPARLSSADLPSTSPPTDFNAYPFGGENTSNVAFIGWRLTNSLAGAFKYAVMRLSHTKAAITAAPTVLGKNPALILSAGFQVTVDYQSPTNTTKYYSYSFLQGNNDSSTWMAQTKLTDTNSIYATVTGTGPAAGSQTITAAADTSQITPWAMATLNLAPTFIKSDPRSIRFNTVIDRLSTASTAAVVNSIWPSGSSPQALGSAATNPAVYAQNSTGYADPDGKVRLGDNGPASTNPYGTGQDAVRPMVLNRPFRSVGEMSYAFRDQPFKTIDFLTNNSADASLMDLFCIAENSNSSHLRAGVVNLNTRQSPVLAALVSAAVQSDDSVPNYVSEAKANMVATNLIAATATTPLINRGDLVKALAADATLTLTKTQHEAAIRALADAGQTRTWNLMIDIIAQSGRYPPNVTDATDLRKFVVQGEKRYWLHVAIDRFTGEVVDQELEAVYE